MTSKTTSAAEGNRKKSLGPIILGRSSGITIHLKYQLYYKAQIKSTLHHAEPSKSFGFTYMLTHSAPYRPDYELIAFLIDMGRPTICQRLGKDWHFFAISLGGKVKTY